jgi:hypothetical protein
MQTKTKGMAKRKQQGLGDTIEAITEATGIKAGVELLSKALDWDCGCEERKEKLNQLWSYRKPKCLVEEDYIYLKEFFSKPQNEIVPKVQWELADIYYRIFDFNLESSNCASCWRDYISQIRQVYNVFEEQNNG